MQVLTSANPTFRYFLGTGPSGTKGAKYLAARHVLVGEASPALLGEWAQGRANSLAQGMKSLGEFALVDLGESRSLSIRNVFRPVLEPVLGARSIKYLAADYGAIVGGCLPYHHDMPYSNGIFGAWCIGGPPRTVRFAEAGIAVSR